MDTLTLWQLLAIVLFALGAGIICSICLGLYLAYIFARAIQNAASEVDHE